MVNIEKFECDLYISKYGLPQNGDYNEIWNQIKNNKQILQEAINIKRNRWNNEVTLNGIAISESILIDYQSIDNIIYQELIKNIYNNVDIARITLHNFMKSGSSFLFMSLWNHNLKLTDDQKSFVVKEATNSEFRHGVVPYDMGYQILRNPNWSLEEKKQLARKFWDDETYDKILEEWEWGVVNNYVDFQQFPIPPFDKQELFNEWTYDMLLAYYKNKETVDAMWREIEFCKQMYEIRPQQERNSKEIKFSKVKK